jgi:AcrR family transcriptional regulator
MPPPDLSEQTVQPDRRARRKAEKQQRILDAALSLLQRQSYLETTIEQITELADVGKGTFFSYFSCKEEIVGAFSEMKLEDLQDIAETGLAAGHSVAEVLRSVFTALVDLPGRSRTFSRNLLLAHMANVNMCEHLSERHRQMGKEVILGLVREGQKRSEVSRELAPMQITDAFFLQIFGVLTFFAMEPEIGIESLRDIAFGMFWRSIAVAGRE